MVREVLGNPERSDWPGPYPASDAHMVQGLRLMGCNLPDGEGPPDTKQRLLDLAERISPIERAAEA